MQFDTDQFIQDALDVVRRYDHALYRRMIADDWRVTTDAYAYLLCVPRDPTPDRDAMPYSWGMTLSEPIRITWLNAEAITVGAKKFGIAVPYFAADVMVHEYRHVHQGAWDVSHTEAPAYRAGSAFADKLPLPAGAILRQMSDDTYTHLYT